VKQPCHSERPWASGPPIEMKVTNVVVPAKAGIHRKWVPASAGTTTLVTYTSMGGPQARGHSEWHMPPGPYPEL